ncbi:alpha/beta hydrolase [Bifidobacterium sp.]|jgi:fermentation-respiration switch protein FrsA (DUF1100 family)|uniref:alpha/beta hydrolase n=1 Tax=Bifidobacterium sp. TaxID=41200 RepID=UPI0025BCE129|nr:alpha/beta hydrolase [Bifidobacterium sp.]MCH4209858.1 lysophospholipase [Bifidobacterium sp.]MCI1224179.1 alpha/beta hydrolase [Bifidobacterium sp.]
MPQQGQGNRLRLGTTAAVSAATAAALGAGLTYLAADHLFRFALDTKSRFSMFTMAKDHHASGPIHLDAQEERKAAQWFEGSKHDVSVTNPEGLRLHAWSFDPDCAHPKPHRYAICCHGFGGGPEEMAKYAHRFARMGFAVLVPASRGQELSDGRYIGMGWLERKDLAQWIRCIADMDVEARILLDGVSMGAATVMMACGEESLPHGVVAAIADCGYASAWDQFMFNAKSLYHLPRWVAAPIVQVMSLIARHRAGYSFRQASCVRQVEHASIPMLFIHGGADDFVSPASLGRVFHACASCQKERLLIPNAGHALGASADPAMYWSRVNGFVKPLFGL